MHTWAWELHDHAHGALGGKNLEFLCAQTWERGPPLACTSIIISYCLTMAIILGKQILKEATLESSNIVNII